MPDYIVLPALLDATGIAKLYCTTPLNRCYRCSSLKKKYYLVCLLILKEITAQKNEVFRGFAHICDALRDLVPFVEFKKREKHPWTVLI